MADDDRRDGRVALVRFWMRQNLLHTPVPLIGAAGLRADVPWTLAARTPAPGSGQRGGSVPSRTGARSASPNSRRLARCVTLTAMPSAQN